MTAPGVGAVISLTYASAIDDPARFKSSKIVGAFFGMTPTRYQSGETDVSGRISRIGDAGVRAILYEGAHVILTKPVKGCTAPKSRAKRIEESAAVSRTIRGLRPVGDGLWLGDGAVKSRAGMKKAKVALARKLAVIMHRMLADGTPFIDAAKAAA
jgi:transposase